MKEERCILHKEIGIWSLVVLAAVLSVFLIAKTVSEFKSLSVKGTQIPSVSVSGEGKVLAKPDIGQVSVSVVREGNTVAVAQFSATEVADKVIASLDENGVEKKDIKTTGYSIQPLYDYKEGERIFRGYEVRQTFEIKIRNIEKSGEIVAAVSAAGVNQVGQLSFTVDDPAKLKAEARRLAIEDARKKARVLAKDLDVDLGDILSFNESSGGIYPVYREALVPMAASAPAPAMPVGENEITVNVNVVYEIR